MAGHLTYEESKRFVYRGLGLLALITLVEVAISLAGKGHIPGFHWMKEAGWTVYIVGLFLIGFSLYKAYFIIYDFMHLRQEVSGMAATILMPMFLLVWAIIAFFHEGNFWGERRAQIESFNELPAQSAPSVSPLEQGKILETTPGRQPMSDQDGVGSYEVDQ